MLYTLKWKSVFHSNSKDFNCQRHNRFDVEIPNPVCHKASWLFILRANFSDTWKLVPSDSGNLFWSLRGRRMFEKVLGGCKYFTNLVNRQPPTPGKWYNGRVISSSRAHFSPFLITYRFQSILGMRSRSKSGWAKQSGIEYTKQKQLIFWKILPMFWEPKRQGPRTGLLIFTGLREIRLRAESTRVHIRWILAQLSLS